MVPMSGVGGVGKAKKEASKRVCVFLMVRKSGGRVWEGQKRRMKKGLGTSWFTRGWEGPGKAQNEP